MSISKPRKTYFIAIDRNSHWATEDDNIAATTAKETAIQYGGCQMVCLNEYGGGHITEYDRHGNIKGYKPLKEIR